MDEGYFNADAEAKVFLHTWSLAVEEQFYFFLPVALIFLKRYLNRFVFGALAACWVMSLGVNLVLTYDLFSDEIDLGGQSRAAFFFTSDARMGAANWQPSGAH